MRCIYQSGEGMVKIKPRFGMVAYCREEQAVYQSLLGQAGDILQDE